MNDILDSIETRIVGALIEKASTTPENYPLTLNSLTIACNQKTSRSPVTDYEESEILSALDRLREKGLARRVDQAGSRVPKFKQVIEEGWDLNTRQKAVLGILMLRGPQTLGEIRQRTDRIHAFATISEVEETIKSLNDRIDYEPKDLARTLPRAPGTKESRYTFAWDKSEPTVNANKAPPRETSEIPTDKLNQLEKRISELEQKVADLEILIS